MTENSLARTPTGTAAAPAVQRAPRRTPRLSLSGSTAKPTTRKTHTGATCRASCTRSRTGSGPLPSRIYTRTRIVSTRAVSQPQQETGSRQELANVRARPTYGLAAYLPVPMTSIILASTRSRRSSSSFHRIVLYWRISKCLSYSDPSLQVNMTGLPKACA